MSRQPAPLILDTDIGGDADDAVALTLAALTVPELALVLTSDELPAGQRARFARYLLDLAGRPEVPVVAGPRLEGAGQFCVAGLIPTAVASPASDVLAAVGAVMQATSGPVRWAGCGPLSNLAHVVSARPSWAGRIHVTQKGGALRYRDPDRGEHNFRRDPAAVHTVLATVPQLRLVLSDVTFTPKILLTAGSVLYQRLRQPAVPAWARLLADHLDAWITSSGHHGSMMHDPLALTAALGLPFVQFTTGTISVDPRGRMRQDPRGVRVSFSASADYPAFRQWLATTLSRYLPVPASPTATPPPADGAS